MPFYQVGTTGLDGTGNVTFFNLVLDIQPNNWPGVRFTGVEIPQGATIISATFSLRSYASLLGGQTGSQWGRWYGDKVANAAAWSDSSRPDQISKTTAFVAAQSNATDTIILNHNVTAIVQEIVNQGSWAFGNAIRFACDPTTANGVTAYYDYSNNSSLAPTLTILIAHSMAAASGSFALTGAATTLIRGKNLIAAPGSFVLTGSPVALLKAAKLVATAGAFVLTVADAALRKGKTLVADAGSFILTGGDVDFRPRFKSFRFGAARATRTSATRGRSFASYRGRRG